MATTCSVAVSLSDSIIIPLEDSSISPSFIILNLYFGNWSISSLVAPSCYQSKVKIKYEKVGEKEYDACKKGNETKLKINPWFYIDKFVEIIGTEGTKENSFNDI